MITMTLGTGVSDLSGTYLNDEFFYTLVNSPTVVAGSTSATATYSAALDDGPGGDIAIDNIVTFHGTGLDTPSGTVTSMEYTYQLDGVPYQLVQADGFNINSNTMFSAIDAASEGDTSALKAIFEGLDWTFAADASVTQSLVFAGTGGNDTVTLGSGEDNLGLDGGNDKINLGAGDDSIDLANRFRYAAAGVSQINGGRGFDLMNFSISVSGEDPLITHGLMINLDKRIDLDTFSIRVKNVEGAYGTGFADTFIGTKGDETFSGAGGKGTFTGGGGTDTLIGSVGAKDTFIYQKASDSGAGKAHDTIYDFVHGEDIINLKAIDPGSKDHAFHFVGKKPLEHAGDLHVVFHDKPGTINDYTLVQGSLDKDKAAEFEIKVFDDHVLSKGDFLL